MCEEDKVNLRHWSKVSFLFLSHHNHRIGGKVPDPRSVPKRQLDPLLFKCLLFVLKPKCNATIRPEHVNIQPPVSACPVFLNFISDDYYNNKDTMNYTAVSSAFVCCVNYVYGWVPDRLAMVPAQLPLPPSHAACASWHSLRDPCFSTVKRLQYPPCCWKPTHTLLQLFNMVVNLFL